MDDPVVREMDVYLSKQLKGCLFLLQYPVRPVHMSYDDTDHLGVRVKPAQHRIEIELALDTDCPSYDVRKGEEIAHNVDGSGPCETSFFSSDVMNKQILSSNLSGCDASRYLLGTLKQGELHLNPVEAIVQLRPSFVYLDSADVRSETAKAQQAADKAEASHDEDEVKPVVAKFARNETEEAKARRVASFEYLKRRNEEELWVKLRYHNDRAVKSQNEKERLFASDQTPLSSSEYLMSGKEYLQCIVTADRDPHASSASASLRSLHSQPVGDQIRTILQRVSVLRFSELLALLPADSDIGNVLVCLQQSADMVEGCWVVKSCIIYPKGSCSSHDKSLAAEVLCQVRDFVLWNFSRGSKVMRQELSKVACLVREEEDRLLGEIAVCCGREGWKFKLDCDTDFTSSYPEVAERQKQRWELRGRTLMNLPIPAADDPAGEAGSRRDKSPCRRTRTASKSPTRQKSRRRRQSSNRSELTDEETGGTAVDSSKKAFFVFRDLDDDITTTVANHVPPISFPASRQNGSVVACQIASSSTNGSLASTPSSNHVSVDVSPPTNDGAASEQLMSAVSEFSTERLVEKRLLTVAELRYLLSISQLQLSPGHVLQTSISDFILEQSLHAVGRKLSACTLQQETMYACVCVADGLDEVRCVVVDMLNAKATLRTNLLKRQLEVQKISCTEDDLKKVLKEFCVAKGGSWHLRNTKS